MWPAWTNMLAPWQWAVLLAVPPAIIALYFLRLKRQPLEVPSTYLWLKSIEDLHVNSLWQRLRQSLLLLLQLLVILLAILALLRPNWESSELTGGRYIFLIDTSASMAASDVEPSRLDEAKRQTGLLIDKMQTGDKAMIISFSDRARVEQPYTDNRKELRRKLAEITQTSRPTSIAEALHVASGLANPGRSATDVSDEQVAEALPAQLFVLSDGRFANVERFNLGNLQPVFIPIGMPEGSNLAIGAFSTRPLEDQPDKLQAYARLDSYLAADASVRLDLYLDGELIDASEVSITAGKSTGAAFDLENPGRGVLELRATTGDTLALDDTAWAAINTPRRARVLVVFATTNEPLTYSLSTDSAAKLADVTIRDAAFLQTEEYQTKAAAGDWDLVIYDRCVPERLPQANTFFIGSLPPEESGWQAEAAAQVPQIIDIDRAHPLMHFLELGDVLVAEARPLKPPPGGSVLLHSSGGPLMAIAPRQTFEDAVLGFELYGGNEMQTNWTVRLSFPVFVLNVLEYLGGQAQGELRQGSLTPGEQINVRLDTTPQTVLFNTPAGERIPVQRSTAGSYNFSTTDQLGVYSVQADNDIVERFTVNLFDTAESDLAVRPDIKLGHVEVEGQRQLESARRDVWKWIVLAALAVLIAEWYIYNRRVYL